MKKFNFLLLLILLSIPDLHSQKIYIGKTADFSHSLIDRINNIVYVYGDSLCKKIDLDSFKADSFHLYIPKEFEFKSHTPLMVDTIPFFIHSEGGLVYEQRNDSLIRIDNSFNHLMQVYSSMFAYDSKIHRFGGYGFWSSRNFITYFDNKNTREWDIINPENSSEFPEESHGGLHLLIHDELYVFNSNFNPPMNRFEYVFNKKLWKYNFIEKTWTYIGDTEFIKIIPTTLSIVYKEKLIIFSEAKFIIIDVVNNTIKEFEKGVLGHQFYHVLNQFYHNNRFYFFDINNSGELYFSIATENETIGKEISSKPFYTNSKKAKTWGLYTFILFLSIIIILVTRLFYKKYNKVLLIKNGLKYRGKFVELDEESSAILKLLLASDTVNSSEILKIIEKKQFSRAHNERLKFQKVEELNLKLKTLLGTGEVFITSKKSDFDRRIRVYSIKKKYFFNLLD